MKTKPGCDRTVTLEQEEYDALMTELSSPEGGPPSTYNFPEIDKKKVDEKLRKIEFYMMIIVGLILVMLLLSNAK